MFAPSATVEGTRSCVSTLVLEPVAEPGVFGHLSMGSEQLFQVRNGGGASPRSGEGTARGRPRMSEETLAEAIRYSSHLDNLAGVP